MIALCVWLVVSDAHALVVSDAHAVAPAPKITDREIVEGLTSIRGDIKRIEESQKFLQLQISELKESTQRQINELKESTQRQISELKESTQLQINDLKESTQRQINDLKESTQRQISELKESTQRQSADLRNLIYVVLGAIVTLIGFILWDRRTALAPAIRQQRVWGEALKEFAKEEPRLAAILRRLHLM